MQIKSKKISETKVSLSLSADTDLLGVLKENALTKLSRSIKIPGFRPGKAPLHVIEKHVNQQELQSEVLQTAMDQMYRQAIVSENLRPVDSPTANVTKFVPFTTLEFEAEVEILGTVKLPDYKKIKKSSKKEAVTNSEINNVIENLRTRSATSKLVKRQAKDGDKVTIDFIGTDRKGSPIKGADGNDYPLVLGSNTFIPGFEANLIGCSVSDEKSFTLTFPKEYGVKALQNKKVTFKVTVKKIEEMTKPKIDDVFAASVGPFKTVDELKNDIKRQLETEKTQQSKRDLENAIIQEIVANSQVHLPKILVDEQIAALKQEINQNLMYRGITYKEMLENEGMSEDAYNTDVLTPEAEQRVKSGLVLAEIASEEKISVSPEELEIRLQILKGQYQDKSMQAELDKPEVIRDIESRLVTEKTIAKLVSYATKN